MYLTSDTFLFLSLYASRLRATIRYVRHLNIEEGNTLNPLKP